VDEDFIDGGCLRGHDWALIEVEERITFSDRIRPICLPFGDKNLPIRRELMVVGWGRPQGTMADYALIRQTVSDSLNI